MTPGNAQELRQWLNQCLDTATPVSYMDRDGRTHLVFLARLEERAIATHAGGTSGARSDETALVLTMIEAAPETLESGATGPRAQEQFLLQCVDATTPVEYQDRLGSQHRVLVTRMTRQEHVRKSRTDEWEYSLTMVDAWDGVWVYALSTLKITIATAITLREHATDYVGSPNTVGLAQIGD